MHIIFRGTPPSERTYRGTCVQCKTVVEFLAGEARIEHERCETLHLVECPVCKGQIYGSPTKDTQP